MNWPISYKLAVRDKQDLILRSFKNDPPTIVISNEAGIYVFSNYLEKVYSSWVIGGTGSNLKEIADFFREKIYDFALTWGRDAPDLRSEKGLLQPIFNANQTPSSVFVYADLVLVELKEEPEEDLIYRLNFLGKEEKLSGNSAIVISYKHQQESENDNDNDAKGQKEEKIIKEEIYSLLNINTAPEDLDLEEYLKKDKTIQLLKEKYLHKAFLNRENLRKRKFNWVVFFEDF
jgi:hypothetical protein